MAVLEETAAKLTPVEWQAVKVAAKGADAARSELEPGPDQEVDLLLRIKGKIDVGRDGESKRSSVPSAVEVLAWILSVDILSEVQRGQLLTRMRELTAEGGGRIPEVEEGYVARATMAIAAVSPVVKTPRKGAVRGAIRVGVVNAAQLSQEVSGAVEHCTRLIDIGG